MKQYILVAGVDYQFTGLPFRRCCEDRKRQVIALNRAREDLRIQIFDFLEGKIYTTDISYLLGRVIEGGSEEQLFDRITTSNYVRVDHGGGHYENRFKRDQYGVMSILHVYAAIRKIGVDAPGTLMELSFFSHGAAGGPVLVNSYDERRDHDPPSPLRVPDDMDGRSYDFGPPNMDIAELESFKNAFPPNGHTRIWGCSNPKVISSILDKVLSGMDRQQGEVDRESLIRLLNLSSDELYELVFILARRIPCVRELNRRQFEIKFKYLVRFIFMETLLSYAYQISRVSQVKAYAPVMGTSSEFDNGGNYMLMHVPSTHRILRRINFYEKYLGFGSDPEHRNYGEYRPDYICSVYCDD